MSTQEQADLIRRIKAHLEKGDQHYVSAGQHLETLKSTCPDRASFLALVKDKLHLGRSRTYELLSIADGTKTAAEVAAATTERSRKHDRAVKRRLSVANGQKQDSPPPEEVAQDNDTDAEQSAQRMKEAYAALEQDETQQQAPEPSTAVELEGDKLLPAEPSEAAGDDNEPPASPPTDLIEALNVMLAYARRPAPTALKDSGRRDANAPGLARSSTSR